MANNAYTICSLIYSILLIIIFNYKERIKTYETKAYSFLVTINLITTILATFTYFVIRSGSALKFIYFLVPKLLLVSYMCYLIVFSLYVFNISIFKNESDNKKFRIIEIIMLIYDIVSIILIMVLPLEYKVDGKIVYSYGQSANVVYVSTGIFILTWIICMLINIKNIRSKKYLPVLAYIILMGIIVVLQKINPALLLSTAVGTFVTVLMYFTIENPDMKLINELNLEKERADKANMAKTDFLSSMSHEIRTPLNAIVGYAQVLKEKEPDSKEEIDSILSATSTLLDIVNGILDISKIEANKLEIINKEYEIKKLFYDLASISKQRLESKNKDIKFILSYDESTPNVLIGDETRIKQVLLNFLTNAIKYTEKGEIEFILKSKIINEDVQLLITVKDTGMGIKENQLEKLYDKFERLDVEKNSNIEGSGLGLAVTKKLVELMNGKIDVKSEYTKGSSFTLILNQKIVEGKTAVEEEKNIIENITFENKKILVVDDNDINLKVASKLLEKYKVSVEESTSGVDAIEKIKNNSYDLILLDDMMPGMSGTETLQKLKENDDFKIPVIVLTANAIVGMKEKYIQIGFNDYIPKPINRVELENKLKKYLKEEK